MSFEGALIFVLAREGGYSANPDDPGGATNHGITQGTYDLWQAQHQLPQSDVATIPMETVKAIYMADYWLAAGCDVLPQGPALAMFDTAVNCGVAAAQAWWAQADGDVEELLWLRLGHYDDLARANPKMQQFLSGWLRRVILLREAVQ